jgi:hypothetical protein
MSQAICLEAANMKKPQNLITNMSNIETTQNDSKEN